MELTAPLVAKVRRSLRRLGCRPGGAVVAVSGGADSVALLRALVALRTESEPEPLVIAHLNHQLRGPESDRDEAFVRELYASLQAGGIAELEFRVERIDVKARAQGENLENVARGVRHEWLADQARVRGLGVVITGHTADDQAETVLHRLIRGTGLQGLRGIAARRPLGPGIDLVRPLLSVTRSEVLAYLEALGQTYCQDSSNAEPCYTRNRIRHELLPLLAAGYNPAIASILCRLAEQADEIFQATECDARRLLTAAELPPARALRIFQRDRLAAAPRHLVREAFRLLWAREGWSMGKMSFADWDRLAAVALGEATAADFSEGIRARVSGRVVQVGPGS